MPCFAFLFKLGGQPLGAISQSVYPTQFPCSSTFCPTCQWPVTWQNISAMNILQKQLWYQNFSDQWKGHNSRLQFRYHS